MSLIQTRYITTGNRIQTIVALTFRSFDAMVQPSRPLLRTRALHSSEYDLFQASMDQKLAEERSDADQRREARSCLMSEFSTVGRCIRHELNSSKTKRIVEKGERESQASSKNRRRTRIIHHRWATTTTTRTQTKQFNLDETREVDQIWMIVDEKAYLLACHLTHRARRASVRWRLHSG